jgi:hypothetical protein
LVVASTIQSVRVGVRDDNRSTYTDVQNSQWNNVGGLRYTTATETFRLTEEEMSGGRGDGAGHPLDALLGGYADRDCVTAAARVWGLAEQARYAVVVQHPADWGAPPLVEAELPARVAGVRLMWRVHAGCAVGVAVLGNVPVTVVAGALPARPGRRVGVSLAVDSLTDVGRARRLADLAARTVTDGKSVACLEERLPAALLTARPDLARELCTRVLAPVLALGRVSRDLLLDTLTAWLVAGGSTHRAAGALFCHRNTVLNRMRHLERLTNRSLSVPADLIELGLALEAFYLCAAHS